MSKLSEEQIKNIPKSDLIKIIDKARDDLYYDLVVKEMFDKYDVDLDEIYLIPIAFKDLDVSARTEHGIIYLNYMLLADGDFESNYHYLVHEMTHFLQQTTGDGPTQGSTDDDYLDNQSEQEGFQNQTKYISSVDGPKEAEEYIEKVLDHHEVPEKEREEREDDLLSIASKKSKEQLSLPLEIKEEKKDKPRITPFERRTRIDFLQDFLNYLSDPNREPTKRPNQDQLHLPSPVKNNDDINRKEIAQKSKEIADSLPEKPDFTPPKIKRKAWDESGVENRASVKDLGDSDYNPNQLKLKLRDFSGITLIEKYFKDTTAEERNKLRRLILDDYSSMGHFLNSYQKIYKPELEPLVIIAKENSTNRFLGWILLQPREVDGEIEKVEIDTMVDRSVRNEGLGSYLLMAAKKLNSVLFNDIHLDAGQWNNVSSNFYMKNELLPGTPKEVIEEKREKLDDNYPDLYTYHLPFDKSYSDLNQKVHHFHKSRLEELKQYEENLKRYPRDSGYYSEPEISSQDEDELYRHNEEFAILGDQDE